MSKTIYIRLDVDNAGDSIELALLNADINKAQNIHNLIQENINLIVEKIKSRNTLKILMRGCDDVLVSTTEGEYMSRFWNELKNEFRLKSGYTLSIGIGHCMTECMLNLRIAKVSGKNKIVETNNI